jgi:hypothetical protein
MSNVEEAVPLATRALDVAHRQGQRGYEAAALYILGEISQVAAPTDLASAEKNYHRAINLAEELRMRPLLAHCQAGLGKLYRRSGNHEKGSTHLTNAVTMMREMEMGVWLERAEAALKELG